MQTEAQFLGGVTSIYLYRGRKRLTFLRGYGLYATSDRLLGVRVSGINRKLLLLPHVIRVSALVGFMIILFGFLQNQAQSSAFQFPIWLILLTLATLANFLPGLLVEKRLKSFSQPRPDWMARGKDFEMSRDRIMSVEFRWPADLRMGHILVTAESELVKIWLAQPASRKGLVLELRDLLTRFCNQNPRIQFVEKP